MQGHTNTPIRGLHMQGHTHTTNRGFLMQGHTNASQGSPRAGVNTHNPHRGMDTPTHMELTETIQEEQHKHNKDTF